MTQRIPQVSSHLSLAGHILLATESCHDSYLRGSVCLVLQHGAEGSLGVVLNRTMDLDAAPFWKVLNVASDKAGVIRFGGPVSGPILAIHTQESLAEVCPATGVYLAAHLDKLQQLVSCQSGEVRFVVGQMVWESGQLEQQLIGGMWYPLPATPELVFAPEEDMWHRGMREVGNRYVAMISGAVLPLAGERN
jgi:putative transcriptional regulator